MRLVFLVPYFNHPKTIGKLVQSLQMHSIDIIIVDDGSDEFSKTALKPLKNVKIITRNSNGGKGAALKTGIEEALKLSYTHIFQIDADMQHNLNKIDDFIQAAQKHPADMICSNPIYTNAPKSRLYGRRITNFWITINTLNTQIKDGMCGMRIYPLKNILPLIEQTHSNRMGFDIEILLNAARNDVRFIWIDTQVFYSQDGISHFRVFKDNFEISKIHAKYFFKIPTLIYLKAKNKSRSKELQWYEKPEKGKKILISLSLFLITNVPIILLTPIIYCISSIYFIISKKERENIQNFYKKIKKIDPKTKGNAFKNFYEFAWSICDKISIWKDRIKQENIIINKVNLKKTLYSNEGHIILTSHFGNVEIARALQKKLGYCKIVIIVHSKNAKNFMNTINEISKTSFEILEIEDLNIQTMLNIQSMIQKGYHIGIMADRVFPNTKTAQIKFLGELASFPQGAFLIAQILGCPISMLWCEKKDKKYHIDSSIITQRIPKGKDKQKLITPFMEIYVRELEKRVIKNPTQWFNFFDFWRQKNVA